MAIPRAGEKCCIHLVRFAKIEEFPDEEPDLDGVRSSFKAGRCQRNVLDREGNYQSGCCTSIAFSIRVLCTK